MKHIVIIGNGVAGITAARHIRKRTDYKITVVSSETPYFFSRTALMYVYMGHLSFENTKPYEDWFWKKNRIDLVFDHAEKVDSAAHRINLRSGKTLAYDSLLIASGSQTRFFDWPGQELQGVQGLYSYQDLCRMETNTKAIRHAVITGGGLLGVEMAEMLRSRHIEVTFLVREPAFWSNVLPLQEAHMISRHVASHGVNLLHQRLLKEILPDKAGKVKAITTEHGEEIACDFVGLTTGVRPNVSWLRDSAIALNEGILVNEYLETSVPDIYAAGDCVERRYRLEGRKQVEQVWYTARMMGEVVAQTICGERTKYEPGPWFNSAKFFDIEFQTYGNVGNALEDDEDELYWEHPSGRKAIHLLWDKKTGTFKGVNSFGIRLRHPTFDQWLREKKPIGFVLGHLREASFEPEFSGDYEGTIRRQYSLKTADVDSSR